MNINGETAKNLGIYKDSIIRLILQLKRKFYTYGQIANYLNNDAGLDKIYVEGKRYLYTSNSIEKEFKRLRDMPKWAGKIPVVKPLVKEVIKQPLKIAIFDIEFSGANFAADRGFMLTWALQDYQTKEMFSDVLKTQDRLDGIYDKNIVKTLVEKIKEYDVLIGYFSSRCDIPYLRSRALINKIPFPNYDTIKQYDLYYIAKYKLKLARNSLENVCKSFNIVGKNHFDYSHWQDAVCCKAEIADKKLAMILDHNIRDVKITSRLYTGIMNYAKGVLKSI